MKRYFLLMVTALALSLAVSAASIADARPAGTTVTAPRLTGPAGVHVGENYTVRGSGFEPGSLVPLEIGEADGCCIALNMVADGSGNFAYTGYVRALGAYGVRAFAQRNGGRWRVAATWSFDAYQ
jgi:hypothetical protein